MKYRSLLIIALPRSGSTALENTCSMMLRSILRSKGELFNKTFYPKCKLKYHASKKYYNDIKKTLQSFQFNHIIRDVIQTEFIISCIQWLKQYFNILYLVRPFKEIQLCCSIKGWQVPSKYLRHSLDIIPEDEYFKRLSYDDFVLNIEPLHKLLKKWYNIWPFDYLSLSFISKRERTFMKMKRYGQRR